MLYVRESKAGDPWVTCVRGGTRQPRVPGRGFYSEQLRMTHDTMPNTLDLVVYKVEKAPHVAPTPIPDKVLRNGPVTVRCSKETAAPGRRVLQ